jgi:two-component system chemotaxis response regulator CheY
MAKTIITIDDAATMRKLIAYTLKGAGYQVLEAPDGPSALSVLADRPVDLIVSDINMPNMNGVELTRRIRGLRIHRNTPILIVTTESELQVRNQAKAAGATGWIVKPFKPDQLLGIVNRVLGA